MPFIYFMTQYLFQSARGRHFFLRCYIAIIISRCSVQCAMCKFVCFYYYFLARKCLVLYMVVDVEKIIVSLANKPIIVMPVHENIDTPHTYFYRCCRCHSNGVVCVFLTVWLQRDRADGSHQGVKVDDQDLVDRRIIIVNHDYRYRSVQRTLPMHLLSPPHKRTIWQVFVCTSFNSVL